MGYDWDDKRHVCYQLYVEEKKSLDEVVDYFRDKLDFVPSKRTFQTQFKRWGFPTKLDYSHKDEAVVQRVREMWELNTMQKDMLSTLRAEGFNVTESGLMRLRIKHGLQLKSPKNIIRDAIADKPTTLDANDASILENSGDISIQDIGSKRRDRDELEAANDAKWRSKKRRRHTKEWNGLPADPPGPPRYPSETTIGEGQKFLGLDDEMYREVRDRFRDICLDRAITKKSAAGPELWDAAKDTLIHEYTYLHQLFLSSDPSLLAPLQLSLDIICMDVTKHMRLQSKTMSLTEARNTLGLNPLESRVLKEKLIGILVANDFVNTYESENWGALREQWLDDTTVKQRIPAEEGPARERYLKAIQLICRDTLKRWREVNRMAKKAESQADDAVNTVSTQVTDLTSTPAAVKKAATKKAARPAKAVSAQTTVHQARGGRQEEVQIDPSLLQAANTSSKLDDQTGLEQVGYPAPDASDLTAEPPLAVYFRRPSPNTTAGVPAVWLGALSCRTMTDLRRAALGPLGGQNMEIWKIEGVSLMSTGEELLYQIDQDDELQGYLLHSEGQKATFVVHLTRTST